MGEKHVNKERDANRTHPFLRVSRYKRGSDITEGDVIEVRVYVKKGHKSIA